MKIKKIIALLFLVAAIVIQGQLVAFADAPPGIDSPFGDTDTGDDDSPPSLEGGITDDDAGDDDTGDDDTPPLEGEITGDDTDTYTAGDDDDDDTVAENIVSETGPGVAFLLIPSLILGYVYRRKR